jgi:lipopolysaccharide biosynthesis regulator YciM
MLKLLFILSFALAIYWGASSVWSEDYMVGIDFMTYHFEANILILASIILVFYYVLWFGVKLLYGALYLPATLRAKWNQQKLAKLDNALQHSLIKFLSDQNEAAVKNLLAILPDLEMKNREIYYLAQSIAHKDDITAITYYQQLLESKYAKNYAASKLAQIHYKSNSYNKAEEYALKSLTQEVSDAPVLMLLVKIYAAMHLWDKIPKIVSQMKESHQIFYRQNSEEIAKIYYEAAKHYLHIADDSKAQSYLEYALDANALNFQALNLYNEIMNNNGQRQDFIAMLQAAFSARPCFEIAQMFIANSSDEPLDKYRALVALVPVGKYPEIFLAISAYLGLNDEAQNIIQAAKI